MKGSYLLFLLLIMLTTVVNGCIDDPDDDNQAPTVSIDNPYSTITEGDTISITATAADADGTIDRYEWAQTSGVIVTLTDIDTPEVTLTAPTVATSNSRIEITVTVTDDDGATATATTTISIIKENDINLPPTVSITPDTLTINEGESASLTATASDPDGQVAGYQWTQVSGVNLTMTADNTDTVNITAPEVTQDSEAVLRVTVTDNDGAIATSDVTVAVTDVITGNLPPTVSVAPSGLTLAEGQSELLTATASDPDGRIVSYLWTQVSGAGLTLDATDTDKVTITAPEVTQDSEAVLRVTVTDNEGATASSDVTVAITDVATPNEPPTVSIDPAALTLNEGESAQLAAVATDPDGQIASYLWTQVSGVKLALSADSTDSVTITAPEVQQDSEAVLRVTVTDNEGAAASRDITVSITNVPNTNQPPTVSIDPATLTLNENESAPLRAAASDPDGQVVSYMWVQVSGEKLTLSADNTEAVTITAPEVAQDSQSVLSVTVTDNEGATATSEITVNITDVANTNEPPTVTVAPETLTIAEEQTATLTGTGTDADGQITGYLWEQISGVKLSLSASDTSEITVTAPVVSQDEQALLSLTVTDNDGATASVNVPVTVTNSNTALIWPNAQSPANSDQWLRDHHDEITELRPRVLVLDPDVEFPPEVSVRNAEALAFALAEGSRYHGYKNPDAPAFWKPEIAKVVHLRDPAVILKFFGVDTERMGEMEPLFTQEFADHIGWEDPENPGRNMTLCELFERGFIHEVWTHGLPTVVFETQSHQQVYDNNMQPIPGRFNDCANGCADFGVAGDCGVTVRMTFINPRRGTGCDVHGHGHMMESLKHSLPLYRKYSSRFWGADLQSYYPTIQNADNMYNCRYNATCYEYPSPQHIRTLAGHTGGGYELFNWGKVCGSVHFPPNATGHYDYYNRTTAANSCENYGLGNGPNGEDELTFYDYNTTIDLDQDPAFGDCGGGWQIYMRQSMPGYQNNAKDQDGNPMKNWWPFLYY